MLESQTAFVDQKFGTKALNTQVANLRDLAFLREWGLLRAHRDKSWVSPEIRAAHGDAALSSKEIVDLARWSQLSAYGLSEARLAESTSNKLTVIPMGTGVDPIGANRRLRTAEKYLVWLMEGAPMNSMSTDHRGTLIRRLRAAFKSQIIGEAKYLPAASLTGEQAKAVRALLATNTLFDCGEHGTRDKLIVRLLLEGLRAGEVLKIQTRDVHDSVEIDFGERVGVIQVVRRPNDIDDVRVHEPAVKTLPGALPIGKRLAEDVIAYVIAERRSTLDRCSGDTHETPYLFICHSGRTEGQPISQRNLNRIVGKLKGAVIESLSPHVLRHTHMTEVEEIASRAGKNPASIRAVLLQRGRWTKNSKMPAHYTKRETARQSAAIVAERDRILEQSAE